MTARYRITKKVAEKIFREDVLPDVDKMFGKDDVTARREAWNNWTDSMRVRGMITMKQYETWDNPF